MHFLTSSEGSTKTVEGKLHKHLDKAQTRMESLASSFYTNIVSLSLWQTSVSDKKEVTMPNEGKFRAFYRKRKSEKLDNSSPKRQTGCTVCENTSHWWCKNLTCKKIVQDKRDLIHRSHRLSTEQLIAEVDKIKTRENPNVNDHKSFFVLWDQWGLPLI